MGSSVRVLDEAFLLAVLGLAGPREEQGLMPPAQQALCQPCQEHDANDDSVGNVVLVLAAGLHLVYAQVHIGDGQAHSCSADEPVVGLEEPPAPIDPTHTPSSARSTRARQVPCWIRP